MIIRGEPMSFLKSFKPKYLQLSVFLAATLFSQMISATQMGTQWLGLGSGSTLIISLDPPLPRAGEAFTIKVTGVWKHHCIAVYEDFDVRLKEQYIYLDSSPIYDIPGCVNSSPLPGYEWEPTPFTRSVVIPNSAWESIDEKKPLNVRVSLLPSWLMPHDWWRQFDLNWGLHEIPPQIGSGHWISDQRPFQGINVEQQGDTVLLYRLAYSTSDGEPSWLMGNASFHGDVTHGVTHHVSWLNPTGEYDRETRDDVQPIEDDMSFTKGSFAIGVAGVNQIYVAFGVNRRAQTYKRYVFRSADNQLPVVIPDMAGRWDLYAFDNKTLEASYPVEFRASSRTEKGLGWYPFKSIDDQWLMNCWANLDGVGTCILTNEDLGITMSYDLVDFNGNYAKAPLVHSSVEQAAQTGILLRAGFHLPVLDFQ